MADTKQSDWAGQMRQAQQRGAPSTKKETAPARPRSIGDIATDKLIRKRNEQLAVEELLRHQRQVAQTEALREQARDASVASLSSAAQLANLANAGRALQASHPEMAEQIANAQTAAAMEPVIDTIARNQQLPPPAQQAAKAQIAARLQKIIDRHKPFKYSLALFLAVGLDISDFLVEFVNAVFVGTVVLAAIGIFIQFCYGTFKVFARFYLRHVLTQQDQHQAQSAFQVAEKFLFYGGTLAEAAPITEDLPLNTAYVLYAWAKAFKDAHDAKRQLARL